MKVRLRAAGCKPSCTPAGGARNVANMRRVAVLVLLAVGLAALAGARPGAGADERARVVRVIDGDTLVVAGGERVRLIGVDTPELRPVECYGRAATRELRRLVGGRRVRLERDVEERDRYGRLLAYVRRGDGLLVNAELVRRGFAQPLTVPPNVRHAARFRRLAREARRERRGLWRACAG
jgi:micrococcal nuclease